MIKYFCDICKSDTTGNVYVKNLNFNFGMLHLCNICYPKVIEGENELFETYSPQYEGLRDNYIQALKNYVEGVEANEQ